MKGLRVKVERCLAWLACILLITACGKLHLASSPPLCRSAAFLSEQQTPLFFDDFSHESLTDALEESLVYWERQNGSSQVSLCGNYFSAKHIVHSLKLFKTLLNETPRQNLARELNKNFQVCAANAGYDILVTGYYQPILQASLEKKAPFIYPLYRLPSDLLKKQIEGLESEQPEIGRLVDGKFVPYWSRAEIEQGGLLQGSEIAYLDDPVQAFFLHVQGSGLLQLRDGSERALLFAGSNGRKYKSIGRLLADEGRIPLAEMSMPAIRHYLHEHLDEQQRILHYNDRYIFFRWGEENGDHSVVGSMAGRLTAQRSVALDPNCFPYGIPAFLETRQPILADLQIEAWQPLRRFVFNHDSGAAIKGSGRLDLFFGRGPEAQSTAGVMKEPGRLYFLIKREANY